MTDAAAPAPSSATSVPASAPAGTPAGLPADARGEHTVSFKVYYEDTDSLGVVYYANYFKYLERGRSEYIEAQGRTVAQWNEAGYLFVVYTVSATFRRPARLGDVVDIHTRVEAASPYRIRFVQRVTRGDETVLDGVVECACMDADGQLRRLPEEFTA